MSEWQPIETAPKDGTSILVCGGVLSCVDMVSWQGGKKRGGWHTEDGSCILHGGFFDYWMPLPDPPKGGDAK